MLQKTLILERRGAESAICYCSSMSGLESVTRREIVGDGEVGLRVCDKESNMSEIIMN